MGLMSFASVTYSQSTKLTFESQNVTIENVFKQIEALSEYKFAYNSTKLDVDRKISLKVENQTIDAILNKILGSANFKYQIVDRYIIITDEDLESSNSMGSSMQQQKNVSGKVTDSSGGSLPGVSVVVKGTTNGTITDADGKYTISKIPEKAVLQFSFVGMKTQEIVVGNKTSISITLSEDAIGIEEVVAVGYGTKLKGELTGAVSKADNKMFEARPVVNTLNALQGGLPGVTVSRGSGRPGSENFSMQIRGASSINGNSPLILIDGIPGDLNLLNPNDILNVTVLKDAAASIYGARAADGVLLITTKSGKEGKLTISYSANYGISIPAYLAKHASTLHQAEMFDEGLMNLGEPRLDPTVFEKIKANAAPDLNKGWAKYLENYPGFYGNTDWYDAIFGNGQQQSHNLSISGGGQDHNYLFSAGYKSNGGILNYGTDKSELFNLRFNFGFKLFNDRLNVETRTSFDDQAITEPTSVDGDLNFLYSLSEMPNYVPIFNTQGQTYWYQNYGNPIQQLLEGGKRKSNHHKFQTNIKADLKILNDLKLVTQVGINLGINDANSNTRTFNLIDWTGNIFGQRNGTNSATYINSKNLYGSYTAYLEYNKTLFRKHQINLMGGASHEQNDYQDQNITGYNFTSNDLFTLNLADKTKTAFMNYSGSASDWALNSYFGRLSYSYDRRFMLDITTRVDGSSKFAPKKRWSALFPAVSASWNLSKEKFIQSLNVFDMLKLRASWGQSGNQNLSFGNYDYIPLITISGNYPLGSPNVGLPGAVASIASESRTWETIQTTNAGIDFAVLGSRLTGSFDYFIKQNNNMLVSVTLPATLGGTSPTQNHGKLETKGWDFSIGWSDSKGDFKYAISAMISDNKSKLLDLKGNDNYWEGLVSTRKGYPLNSYFGYESDGIIKNSEELAAYKELGNVPVNIGVGDVKYKDLDGDGKITAFGNPATGTKGDMKYLGDRNPRYTYSSNINLKYKNFELSILLQGVGRRNDVRTGTVSRPLAAVWNPPLEWFYGKTWTVDRPNAEYPRIIPGYMGLDNVQAWDYKYSDRRIISVAYMRVKSLILAYNIPQSFCNQLKMQSIRVYASGQDLFTISKGTWGNSFDPEEERIDNQQTYPFTKVISFGIDVKF